MFVFELHLFVSFVIDLKPAKLTLLSVENFPFAQKFTVLGFLLFKSLFGENIFGGYYFRKDIFRLKFAFQKMVELIYSWKVTQTHLNQLWRKIGNSSTRTGFII
jgi:hypothetical protein